ncbi:class A beta-lactamase-related serine hydrolase [Alteromonas sediminis]|uniref:Class A beta-lactamase-related serine hydrolase n=1 Tax=Alteromonas sediminis TaxID=2259342 RepID=A0A3N5Z783_9ALTE|nr:serine hydrolase domain-containing protein [Alteromonas sediminis]RPJ66554.1 class A beta-lactamase-related serine hydrolase [Alteromonas sediminis]
MKTAINNALLVGFFLLNILLIGSVYSASDEDFSWVKNELTQADFSGLLIVAKERQVILRASFGYANREEKLPFNNETVFDIGSITKQFLATAILKLSEDGTLSLHNNLATFFDNVPQDKTGITVHHLLTHTSGLPTNLSGHKLYDIVPYEALPRLAFKETLASTPGEIYQYSNVGYSLLARILEKVSGQNWEAFLIENVFKPSGMLHTGYRLLEYRPQLLAVNYGADQTAFQKFFSIEPKSRSVGHSLAHLYQTPGQRWMEGAGGLMSTIDDMYRWYLALSAQTIVNKASWNAIFTPHIREGKHSHYGYGWAISVDEQGRRLIAHNGSNGYSFADFKYYPEEDIFIFVATNDIDNYPEDTFKRLSKVVFGSNKSKPHSTVIRDTQ